MMIMTSNVPRFSDQALLLPTHMTHMNVRRLTGADCGRQSKELAALSHRQGKARQGKARQGKARLVTRSHTK
eukprot:scaffold1393_cov15-Prasinocladus_malaysianus.AAC.1